MRPKLFLFFIALFLVSYVSATTIEVQNFVPGGESFSVSFQKVENKICSCAFSEQKIYVQNNGLIYSNYLISLDKESSKYSTLLPSQFMLQPGETQEITLMTNAPCGLKRSFDTKMTIQTDLGSMYRAEQKTDFGFCENIQAGLQQPGYSNCNCVPTIYALNIRNSNSFVDTFSVSYLGDAWVEYNENPLILSPGEMQIVYAKVITPCSFNGVFKGNFIIESLANKDRKTLPFTLTTLDCLNTTVAFNQGALCLGEDNKVDFTISNNGKFNSTYNAYLISKDSQKIESIKVDKGKTVKNSFTINPKSKGKYNALLRIEDSLGISKTEKQASFDVGVCHDFTYSMWKVEKELCSSSEYNYAVRLTNTGIKASYFNISSSAPFAKLDKAKIYVNPGQMQEFMLTVFTPTSGDVSFDIIVEATGIKKSIPISFSVIPKSSCYKAEIIDEKVFDLGNKTSEFRIKNTGKKGALFLVNSTTQGVIADHMYTFLWPGEKSKYYAIGNVTNRTINLTISSEGQHYKESVSVAKKANRSWWWIILLIVLLLLLLVFKKARERIEIERIRIPKKKKVIAEKRVSTKIFSYLLVFMLMMALIILAFTNAIYIPYIALVILLVVFFVLLFAGLAASSWLRFVLVILAIIAIAFFVMELESIETGDLLVGENMTMNLSEFSGNGSIFLALGAQNTEIQMIKETAVIKGVRQGTDNITFMIIDSSNMTSLSPEIKVSVVEDKVVESYIYSFLVLLSLVLILMFIFRRQ